MKWNIFSFQTMFKRVFRYLLKRYLGQYLEDFSQDELTCGVSLGKGSLEDVRLNVEVLNELSEEYNLPFEFLHGFIDFVSISIPWMKLFRENSVIEIRGLQLVVQAKERPEDASVFDSMWASMVSSLDLAQDCLNTKTEDDEEIDVADRSEGLEKIAMAIDAVLANMKVRFLDSKLRIEHVLENGVSGIALEVKIAVAEYFDEAGINVPSSESNQSGAEKCIYEPQAFCNKKIIYEGVSLHTSEFSVPSRTFPISKQVFPADCLDPSQFEPGSPEMPPTHSSLPVKKTEPDLQCDPVLISKLNGQQELRIKLKQNEAVIGPKVDVEFNFGAFNLFLTPQQVHMLFKIISSFIKPGSCVDASKKLQPSVANKPMRAADYALVEQELLRQQEKSDVPSRSLKNQRGWSSHSLDESDEEFHLMTMENRNSTEFPSIPNDNDSLCSSISSDTRSEGNLMGGIQRISKARGSIVQAMLQDPVSELTHFRGCCSSFLIIILHDDSVQESLSSGSSAAAKSSCVASLSLKERAETFFNDLASIQMCGFDFKDFASAREPLSKLCETNHLRLMASAIALDGNEKSSSSKRILNFTISFYQFEVLECLFNSASLSNKTQNPTYMQILSFENKLSAFDNTQLKEACFKLKYQQVEYTSQNRVAKPPANKLDIQFGIMTCEVDISLTDRIRTLLNFQNFFIQHDKYNDWKDSEVGAITRISPKTEITISSPNLVINLRFPVPDLRSSHDMERVPWWQQNLHKEILIMQLQDVTFITTVDEDTTCAKFEIQCRDFHGLFQSSSTEKPISFLRVSVDPDVDEISRDNGFDWPRLVIQKIIKMSSADLESGLEENDEMFAYSLSDVLMSNLDNEPSPFCSTSVIHGPKYHKSNNQEKEGRSNLSADHDEVIRPADKESIMNFIEQIVNKSEYVFEFTLPTVNLVLPNKDFFEVIYNRLGSDLLLWENASLAPAATYDPSGFKVHVPGLDFNSHIMKDPAFEQFPIFKPFSNDSNSDSDDEDATYCSVHEYYQRQRQKQKKKTNNHSFTKISISLAITKGMLTINTPAVDSSNIILPEQCGKMQLHIEEGLIFIASTYKGDPNESYMCVLTEKSTLYHAGTILQISEIPTVQSLSSCAPNKINCIIYESESGMLLKPPGCENRNNKDMLKIAIHIVSNPKQLIKTFKVAIEISGATLRHYMHPIPQIWINQFIDFLKVKDYPVNGYIPPAVVTELHLNLSNCAIDYRPLKLPFQTAITVENFNMSCNVTATTPSFLFRIISEEMRLFLTNNINTKKVDLRKNYVCIIDTGLIDISFRTNVDEKNEPKLEMCVTNNKVHIRTCADSFKALMDLIVYLSINGDMEPVFQEKKEIKDESRSFKKTRNIDSDTENLHILMAEAMRECSFEQVTDKNVVYRGLHKNLSEFDISNTDDEFCILEDDPGIGLMPRNGEPQIRMLTDEPIKIVDNHFSVPPGKSDVLKAPKHFPNPLVLVALREMSLVWHLYGGSDFKSSSEKPRRRNIGSKNDTLTKTENGVTFFDEKNVDIDASNVAVSFCKVTPVTKKCDINTVHYSMEQVTLDQNKGTYSVESWLHRGGPCRNHDILMELQMNKVQFQREIYPADNEYASRYILLVHDIEIRDRLAASQINKFLYQYSSKTIPRQSHANMIDVKAVYTRPDPKRSTEECSLRVSCKPLRLNVDQDALMFLIDFFQEVLELSSGESIEGELDVVQTNVSTKESSVSTNQVTNANQAINSDDETFYRFFSFSPDVLIRIDYHGKRVLMEQGALRGLLMGLGQLNASEIKLKRLCYRHGLLGHQKVLSYAMNEWQQDILKNQLPSLLGGVGPMHSFVQLFQGIKDLFYLPVIQYRRDGQIVRGLQRGASSFSTSTAMAFLDLTSRLVGAIQGAAEVAYDMVSPGPSVACKFQGSQEPYRRTSQPADIREGVATAYNVVKEGLGDTARTIYRVASTEHEHKGVPGAVGGVLRQIPPSLFKPIILGSEATHCLLGGVRHQLMPDAHQEDIHKWRTKSS